MRYDTNWGGGDQQQCCVESLVFNKPLFLTSLINPQEIKTRTDARVLKATRTWLLQVFPHIIFGGFHAWLQVVISKTQH